MDAIKPRKLAAMGGSPSGSNFGITPMASANKALGHIDRDHIPRRLGDDERGAKSPVSNGKKFPNQANPDHGPHHATGACPFPK